MRQAFATAELGVIAYETDGPDGAPAPGLQVAEDIFGASSTWSVIGSGYSGGSFSSTNSTGTAISVANYVDGNFVNGYLINPNPVVVQGTVTLSFLKNLPQ